MVLEQEIANLHIRVWSFTCWQATFHEPIPKPSLLIKREMTALCYLSIWYLAVTLSTHFQECTAPQQNVSSNQDHRPCTTSLKMSFPTVTKHIWCHFLEDSGKFKCWTVLPQQMWTIDPLTKGVFARNTQKQFQILQVTRGNIWVMSHIR